jgi:hypothetical protein
LVSAAPSLSNGLCESRALLKTRETPTMSAAGLKKKAEAVFVPQLARSVKLRIDAAYKAKATTAAAKEAGSVGARSIATLYSADKLYKNSASANSADESQFFGMEWTSSFTAWTRRSLSRIRRPRIASSRRA